MKDLIPQKLKNVYHLFRSMLAVVWFRFPARKIKVIGVTGTNGKTTVVQMAAGILEEAGYKVAVSSTINFKIGKEEWVNRTKFTTLSGWHTQRFIRKAVNAGCDYLVLEVASHALDQNRLWGIDFDVAVITNVTREHLDYHKTMEEYREAKKKIFKMLKPKGVAVVNLDMSKPEEFIEVSEGAKVYGYSLKKAIGKKITSNKLQVPNKLQMIKAENIKLNLNETGFRVDDIDFNLNLSGDFNIENALAAVCVGLSQGINLETASAALSKIEKIPGRMDYVENDRGLKIIIDYALTPDSMEKLGKLISDLLLSISNLNRGKSKSLYNRKSQIINRKLIWVFGACGERDRGKRPIMGEIVSRYADYVIVTNEDPYGEEPERIINEVFSGVVNKKVSGSLPNYQLSMINDQSADENKSKVMVEGKNAFRIMDREEAIKKALELAQEGDIILITGKGAEEIMAVGKKRIRWNDRRVVEELLKV